MELVLAPLAAVAVTAYAGSIIWTCYWTIQFMRVMYMEDEHSSLPPDDSE